MVDWARKDHRIPRQSRLPYFGQQPICRRFDSCCFESFESNQMMPTAPAAMTQKVATARLE